jgi:hypothetical protein
MPCKPTYPLDPNSTWGKKFIEHADQLQYMVNQMGYCNGRDKRAFSALTKAIERVRKAVARKG